MLNRQIHFEQVPAAIARKIAEEELKRAARTAVRPISHKRLDRARRRQAAAVGRED
jgi:hypothetical protein